MHRPIPINVITGEIVTAAMRVHSRLGPGLLESVYLACLAYELRKRGFRVRTQVPVPVVYDAVRIPLGFRVDMLVEESVVVATKTIDRFHPIDEAQLLSYLILLHRQVGLLINFHSVHLKDGLKRMVSGLQE